MRHNSPRRKYLLFCIVVLVVILGLVIVHVVSDHRNKSKQQASASSSTAQPEVALAPSGIVYPASWVEATQISVADEQAGVISGASQASSSTTVIVRKQADQLAKNFTISTLPEQVVTSLKSGVSGFSLLSKAIVQIQPYSAVEIGYTSKGSNNQAYTNEMYIIPTQQTTFYITYSGTKAGLAQAQGNINTINASVALYVKTHSS